MPPTRFASVEQTLGNHTSLDPTFTVGEAMGSAATDDHEAPFGFTDRHGSRPH